MSHNTAALTKDYDYFSFHYNSPQSQTFVSSGQTAYNYLRTNIHSVQIMAFALDNIGAVPNNSNYLTISAKFNFVTFTDNNSPNYLPSTNELPELYNVTINGDTVPFSNSSVDVYITDWVGDPFDVGVNSNLRTFTYNFSCVIPNIPSSINTLTLAAKYYTTPLFTGYTYGFNSFFEYDVNNFAQVDFSNDINSAILHQQVQNQNTIINQNQQIIDNQNQNTQDIIDNQNQNTQDIIRSNQRCSTFNKTFNSSDINVFSKYLNSLGSEVSFAGWGIIKDVEFYPNLSYDVIFTNFLGASPSICQYSGSKELISCIAYDGRSSFSFTSASNAKYFSLSIPNYGDVSIRVSSEQEYCTNFNEEYYNEQRQADQNISNQTPSDIQGSENQTTTNLIGVLSGFISAFSNINATNCNLTLDFPNYAGGTRIVDICQGKERAPRIVEIGSSLLLIGVFVPLSYFLIKMIYNEIRSWTNG